MLYCKSIEPKYLAQLLDGRKSIEGRMKIGEWAEMEVGDMIQFGLQIFIIVEIYEAASFESLYVRFRKRLLPDINTVAGAVDLYSKLAPNYSLESQLAHGVLGFELVPI